MTNDKLRRKFFIAYVVNFAYTVNLVGVVSFLY